MFRSYKIKKQNNNRGYHAGFTLSCSFQKQDTSVKSVDFAIEGYEEQWKEATLEGIAIFHTFYKEHFKGELTIAIKEIYWFPVDTRDLLVTYTIIRVLCHWFQLDYLLILNQPKFETLYFFNDLSFVTEDGTSFFI